MKFQSAYIRLSQSFAVVNMKLFYVATVFCFFFLRRDRIFSLHVANPDEAELLASGRRAMQSLTPYARFSSPTYGPAWAMFLGVLGRLGVPLTLPTAHILSALIGAGVCIIATSTFAKFFDKITAFMLISPLMLYWSFGFNHSDYWSLSTELLPMLFLVGGSALAFIKSTNTKFVLLGASFVGLGAWSKYQFGLLALAILFALVRRLVSNGFGSIKAMICIGLASNLWSLVLFLAAISRGVPSQLAMETFSLTLQYISGGGLKTEARDGLGFRVAALAGNLISLFPLIPIILISLRNPRFNPKNEVSLFAISRRLMTSSRSILAATAISLLGTYPIFPHYNYVLISGALVALMAWAVEQPVTPSPVNYENPESIWGLRSPFQTMALALSIALVSPNLSGVQRLEPSIRFQDIFSKQSGRWARAQDGEGRPLSHYCPPGSTALVWGWSSEIFAFYDLKPASRYVATAGLIEGNAIHVDISPLRRRLVDELLTEPPRCVIDAVGPSFFPGYGPMESMAVQMPRLWSQLKRQSAEIVFYWDGVNPFTVLVQTKK